MSAPVPSLSILDLSPISSGQGVADAFRNTLDLARHAERLGYGRYWLAEHHVNPGVAASAPELLIQAVAAATTRIRVGSGAVLVGRRTPLEVVEAFGTLDAFFPGRIDLGLGRTGRPKRSGSAAAPNGEPRRVDGVLIPRPVSFERLLGSPRLAAQLQLLRVDLSSTQDYGEFVDELFALVEGRWRSTAGLEVHAVPGEGARFDPWICGSSGGDSATVAGERGLPFAANYHISPASVLEAVEGYREAFRPSARLSQPYVMVSADVVVGPDDATARELAAGYGPWVRSIRLAEGAIPFPTPAEAAEIEWTDADRELVADRVDTQFVGSPETVVRGLSALRAVTGADELLITTITHDHADRVRSYELLAQEWARAEQPTAAPARSE